MPRRRTASDVRDVTRICRDVTACRRTGRYFQVRPDEFFSFRRPGPLLPVVVKVRPGRRATGWMCPLSRGP